MVSSCVDMSIMLKRESNVLEFWNVVVIRSMLLCLNSLVIGSFELLSYLDWVGVGLGQKR